MLGYGSVRHGSSLWWAEVKHFAGIVLDAGDAQTLIGPVLKVPYLKLTRVVEIDENEVLQQQVGLYFEEEESTNL